MTATVEGNIEVLSRAILSEAGVEIEDIKNRAREQAGSISRRAQDEAEQNRRAILENASREARRLREQAIAAAELKARTLELGHREQLLQSVFQEVTQRLPAVFIVTGNDIYVENLGIPRPFRRGYELVAPPQDFGPIPFARTVRIEKNKIHVVGDPDEGFTAGMHIGTDVGTPGYAGTIKVEKNTIIMENGTGGMIFGPDRGWGWLSVLNGAIVRNNKIRGYAQYGILSINGAQYCKIFGNELARFEPSIAHILGFYGPGTHHNKVRGYTGVVIEADGAYNNHFTGYKKMSP